MAEHEHKHDGPPGDGAVDWDERYGSEAKLFSGHVNGALVAEMEGSTPGSALDVGCGEGADAVWLAQAGWQVTAVDISQVAINRARAMAAEAGVTVERVQADVTVDPPTAGHYDLVSMHYPALRHSAGPQAVQGLIDAVAPGGTLLVVGHDMEAHGHTHPDFDPADYVQPPDIARHLGDGWTIEIQESRPRVPPPGHEGPDVPDLVLRARLSG